MSAALRRALLKAVSDLAALPPLAQRCAGPLLGAVSFGALLAWLILDRRYMTYGVETDFIWRYIPQALSIQSFKPFAVPTHPPLYSFLLALTQPLFGDWWSAGLALSFVGAMLAVTTSLLLLLRMRGPWAAAGAWLGMAGSAPFLIHCASAGTDAVFLGLFGLLFLLYWRAAATDSPLLWTAGGLTLGAVILTRGNGLLAGVLLVLPCLTPSRRKVRNFLLSLGAAALPVLLLGLYGRAEGFSLVPQVLKSPMGQPSGIRQWADLLELWATRPLDAAETFLRNYAWTVRNTLPSLLVPPLGLLALPGFFLLSRRAGAFILLYAAAHLLQFLAAGAYPESLARLHLCLVPLMGACAGMALDWLASPAAAGPRRPLRRALSMAALLILVSWTLAKGWDSIRISRAVLHAQDMELSDLLGVMKTPLPEGCRLMARKPHAAYYLHCAPLLLPETDSLVTFERLARPKGPGPRLFVYFGPEERLSRPGLEPLAWPQTRVPWLRYAGSSGYPGAWAIHELLP